MYTNERSRKGKMILHTKSLKLFEKRWFFYFLIKFYSIGNNYKNALNYAQVVFGNIVSNANKFGIEELSNN